MEYFFPRHVISEEADKNGYDNSKDKEQCGAYDNISCVGLHRDKDKIHTNLIRRFSF